jgi:hypothetical protein
VALRSVVLEIDVDFDFVTRGRCTHNCTDALCGTPTATDHTTKITISDTHLKANLAAVFTVVNANRIWVIDD